MFVCVVHSMVRVLRERYLTPAAPLELPVESKIRVGLARKSAGDMAEVAALQLTLAENLRNYWSAFSLCYVYTSYNTCTGCQGL